MRGTDDDGAGPARSRAPHLMKRYLLLVGLGGAAGTAARYGAESALPSPGPWPLPTLAVNVVGAFLLGMLLEALVRRGVDIGRRRSLRLLVGTGFLGSFTTYSTLAVESVLLLRHGDPVVAGLYLSASVVAGIVAGFAGIWVSAARHRPTAGTGSGPDDGGGPGGTGGPGVPC